RDLRVIEVRDCECDLEKPCEEDYSVASRDTVIAQYESRTLLRFFANGTTAGRVNLDNPSSAPGKPTRLRRDAIDYELAVRDHYRSSVRYWQETDHWADRSKRLIRNSLGSASKTEHIFHRALLRWLELHLDGDVRSSARDSTSDETD